MGIKSFINFKILYFASTLSVILMSTSCVSLNDQSKEPQVEAALNTQKTIIINHLNRGEPNKAFQELRPALQRFPENNDLRILMGLTQLALRNPRNAITHLRKAHDESPTGTTVLNLSSAYIEAGFNVKAIKLIKSYMKKHDVTLYSYPERIYHNLGLAFERLKKVKTASKYYRKALNENPKFYLTLMQLAGVYEKRGLHKSARKYFREAGIACGSCYESIEGLANNYAKTGKKAAAAKLLKSYASNKKLPKENREKAMKMVQNLSKPTLTTRKSRTAKANTRKGSTVKNTRQAPKRLAPPKRNARRPARP